MSLDDLWTTYREKLYSRKGWAHTGSSKSLYITSHRIDRIIQLQKTKEGKVIYTCTWYHYVGPGSQRQSTGLKAFYDFDEETGYNIMDELGLEVLLNV